MHIFVIINQKTGDVVYSYGDSNKASSAQKNTRSAPKKEETPKQETPKPVEKPVETPKAEEPTKLQQKVNNAIPENGKVEVASTIPKEKAQHELLCEDVAVYEEP